MRIVIFNKQSEMEMLEATCNKFYISRGKLLLDLFCHASSITEWFTLILAPFSIKLDHVADGNSSEG